MKFIRDIMSTDLLTVHTQQNLSEVSTLFREHDIHHVPVVDGNQPVGVIASSDLYKLVFDIENTDERMIDAMLDAQFSITEVMVKDVATISENDRIRLAADKMSSGDLRSLLVTNDAGELIGIVTSTDLIRLVREKF